jgi:DNA polymerase-3 subunit gamma/tau
MSYVVLARKYRPQTFRDVVGQDPVSQTLLNALESGRVAHAYVFSGPRGVGKTTTARILAKCLNCAKGVSITPCDKCPSCLSIAQGTSVDDVLEIDGASNRGIEQIRELRESAKYTPSSSRYRIYIIDEAHQITKDAFGALLKILEEPPAHVVFMMATTEVHKIPAPILSRCQRFSLRPIAPEDVLAHLKKICTAEKIKADEAALADIVRFVEGSMRDALSLLDQAIVFAPEKITSQTLRDLLGLLPTDTVRRFATTINAGKPEDILTMIQSFLEDGIDLSQLGKDLQLYYHDLLLAKAGVKPALATATANDLQKESAGYDFNTLERNIRLLSRALEDMRRSETPRAIFDTYALRLGQKTLDARTLIERLDKLEKSGGGFSRPPVASPVMASESRMAEAKPSVFNKKETVSSLPEQQIASVAPLPRNDISPNIENWAAWLQDVAQIRQSLASALEESKPSLIGKTLVLIFGKSFHEQMVVRSMDSLRPFIVKHFGAGVEIQTKLVEAPAATAPHANTPQTYESMPAAPVVTESLQSEWEDLKPDSVGNDIQKAMKHFSGALKREKPA